ncbi:geranylgeranylglycerol-phosphate geranylgeranyltransferase [Flavobacterium sp. BFFFF1]|uniref:geranylgeranylglycerol-phosphate geranylgeranyltransferase n=1 Tax=Flavobacterium sp. BFFFF1 TaxID=2015557 RepID=UPI0025B8B2A8|nr:geranylgeranylglycerol-phosphate geranylgeranyltransferase [Flavobacterium sp. BFFFF1]
MNAFLKLIRFKNLLMIVALQLIIKYCSLDMQHIPTALNDIQYLLLVLSTVCIAAGGYIINNIIDQGTDFLNKPADVIAGKAISESMAYNFYAGFNILGVGIGFYLSNIIGKPGFAMIFIAISATLYLYATSYKKTFLIGNILVAAITSMCIIIVGIYELYPILTEENHIQLGGVFEIFLDYALFSFILNLIREITKDAEDIKGDTAYGMNTLPIVLGIGKTKKILLGLGILTILGLLYYINTYYINNELYYVAGFMLLFVVGPLLYFVINILSVADKTAFKKLSTVLKLVILSGIISILVLALNIQANA